MEQKFEVYYEAPRKIEIGDVFYQLASADCQSFRDKCPVCGDTQKVTVNGVTFACPVCKLQVCVCSVHAYIVKRWRVYSFTRSISTAFWKMADQQKTEIQLYSKSGTGWGTGTYQTTRSMETFVRNLNREVDETNFSSVFFDRYELACSEAKRLTDNERAKLDKYNAEVGKNYQFVQTSANDKKSK